MESRVPGNPLDLDLVMFVREVTGSLSSRNPSVLVLALDERLELSKMNSLPLF
jgi:hypothetical protein